MKPNLDKRSIALQTIGFLANNKTRVGSDATDPRKAHQTTIFGWKGFWITPWNLFELMTGK